MQIYQCDDCEKLYPKRQANNFATRKLIRKHLKKVHGYKHSGTKIKNERMGRKCYCLRKHYEIITLK